MRKRPEFPEGFREIRIEEKLWQSGKILRDVSDVGAWQRQDVEWLDQNKWITVVPGEHWHKGYKREFSVTPAENEYCVVPIGLCGE